MTSPNWQRVDELLDAVMDMPARERATFLDHECDGDTALRREVESLLAAHDQASGVFDSQPAELADDLIRDRQAEALVGHAIGPYRIVREIGRGGMGVVYLAERTDDQYRRQVAVKLLWPGMLNTEIVRRFRRERQILANLDHPHVAKLFDGGTTEEGWPYFVMEYVAGQPITEYCKARRLAVAERLRLFQQVCAAVQYAHQTLIIHRDLKPGNILVTEEGTAKLLDFGIAKLLDPARHAITAQPTTNALMMTPDYASPEQMRGEAITTASDVYSLGILLYELLTGGHPYQIKDRSLPELVRVVCEKEPEAPSQRVGQFAKLPQGFGDTKPERLRAQLRGDLDQITQTAIQKDANIRYRSVEQLSEDITRHFDGLPIRATAVTLRLRFGKFVRRNKLAVTAVASVLLALTAGIITTTWQARIAREQAKITRRNLYVAQMNLLQQDWETTNIRRFDHLLAQQIPQPGQEDLRGFEWYYFWRARQSEREIATIKTSSIASLAFSPNGKLLASGHSNGTITLWDATTHTQLRSFKAYEISIQPIYIAFSPDGKILASGLYYFYEGGAVKLWDVATGQELPLNYRRVPDGAGLTIWDTNTGQERPYNNEPQYIKSLAFSPDGKWLAMTCDGTLKLLDFAAGREQVVFKGHPGSERNASKLVFSHEEKILAFNTGSTVELWELTTKRKVGSYKEVSEFALSANGKMLATNKSDDNTVKLWNVAKQKEIVAIRGDSVIILALAFSPDGKTLAVSGADSTIRLWDVVTGEEVVSYKGHENVVDSIAFSPDGKILVSGSYDHSIKLWNVATPQSSTPLIALANKLGITSLSPDGKMLASAFFPGGVVNLWSTTTGQELAALKGHEYAVGCIEFSPDGKTLVSGANDFTLRIWDIAAKREIAFLKHQFSVSSVAFSPDGRAIASCSSTPEVRLWDAVSGRELPSLKYASKIGRVRFSPDGKLLVSGDTNGVISLREVMTGREVTAFKGHEGGILAFAFSPDGKILASGSFDSLRLWDIVAGKQVAAFMGQMTSSIAFSPDGKTLASNGLTVKLWNVATWSEVVSFKDHKGGVSFVAFSPDGTLITVGGNVRFWRAATPQEVAVSGRR